MPATLIDASTQCNAREAAIVDLVNQWVNASQTRDPSVCAGIFEETATLARNDGLRLNGLSQIKLHYKDNMPRQDSKIVWTPPALSGWRTMASHLTTVDGTWSFGVIGKPRHRIQMNAYMIITTHNNLVKFNTVYMWTTHPLPSWLYVA